MKLKPLHVAKLFSEGKNVKKTQEMWRLGMHITSSLKKNFAWPYTLTCAYDSSWSWEPIWRYMRHIFNILGIKYTIEVWPFEMDSEVILYYSFFYQNIVQPCPFNKDWIIIQNWAWTSIMMMWIDAYPKSIWKLTCWETCFVSKTLT